MEVQGVRINELVSQSMVVITKPSIQTFEQFEKRGGKREALVYVLVAAALAGIVSALFGVLFGGLNGLLFGLLSGFITPVIGFFVFAYVLSFAGKQQGGTGTEDEVFYTCALYTAPLLAISGIISGIPILGFLLVPIVLLIGLYQIYLGYVASRSSMNLQQNPAIISVVAAVVAQFIANGIVVGILGTLIAVST